MKRLRLCLVVALLLCSLAPVSRADQKIKKRMTAAGHDIDTTSYVKGERSRDEMDLGGMQMITIHQCDTKKTITVNLRTNACYVTTESEPGESVPRSTGAAPKQRTAAPPEEAAGTPRKGGTITINTSVTDTGERKQLFGFTARHVKSSMAYEASPDACNPGGGKMESDGWYIDFAEGTHSCVRPERQMFESGGRSRRPDCEDKIQYRGPGVMAMTRLGYPADVTMTMTGKDGQQSSMRTQALEISRATLDPALFDLPPGCRVVKSMAELYGMGSIADMMRGAAASRASSSTPSRGAVGTPEARSAKGRMGVSRRAVGTGEVGPKQPGKVRVGVVQVNDKTNHSLSGEDLRRALISNLGRFGLDAVPVDGGNDSELVSDCKEKDCDYLLYTDVASLKEPGAAKKAGGMFGRALGGLGAAASSAMGGGYEAGTAYRLFKITDTKNAELEGTGSGKGQAADQSVMPSFDHESRDVMTQIQKDAMMRK